MSSPSHQDGSSHQEDSSHGSSQTPFLITSSDVALVASLVKNQFPHLADLPVSYGATGWDNLMFRLGDSLAARMPRRITQTEDHNNEITWQNIVASPLTVAYPWIEHVGAPSTDFPHPWTIVRWVAGSPAMHSSPSDRDTCAQSLGMQLALIHQTAPIDAPVNPFRGTPLHSRSDITNDRFQELTSQLPANTVSILTAVWEQALSAPRFGDQPMWCHGDLHPGNYVLTAENALAGIIDFGDLTSGDPAVDLSTAWLSFTPVGRKAFF